jgi:undecaprenyl-diphosphatase
MLDGATTFRPAEFAGVTKVTRPANADLDRGAGPVLTSGASVPYQAASNVAGIMSVVSPPAVGGPVTAPAAVVPLLRHLDPPTSPSRFLGNPLTRLVAVTLAFVGFAVLAAVDGGSALLRVDEPIERFVVTHRSAWLDEVFRRISFFGSTPVVLVGGLILAVVAWRKCRVVAALVVVATLARPLMEFTLKESIGRDRPTLAQLVNGEGHSFPSGHVLAAAALWAMVPVVLSLYTQSRRLWWVAAIGAVSAVALIGASRVYLGVHWASDVIAGTLAAALLLGGLDLGFRRLHERRHCGGAPLSRPSVSR